MGRNYLERRVCDSCREAAADEIEDYGLDGLDLEEIAGMLGADLPDHLCDEVEAPETVYCFCACAVERRRRAA